MNESNEKDRRILRNLAWQLKEIVEDEEQSKKKALWEDLNDLKPKRPMVIIDQLPWHELNVEGELDLKCSDDFSRIIEKYMRRSIYKYNHFKADQVFDPYVNVPKAIKNFHFGFDLSVDDNIYHTMNIMTDSLDVLESNKAQTSIKYEDIIPDDKALYRIKAPVILGDEEQDEQNYDKYSEIFNGILPVRMSGVTMHCGVWDRISEAHGVENIYMDLMDRPDFMKKVVVHFTQITHNVLDQLERLNLLDMETTRVHYSPTYLAQPIGNAAGTKASRTWGFGMSQLFGDSVSKQVVEEFDIDIINPLYERFGLLYYGCCEALHNHIDAVRKIKNLRKISSSPFDNVYESAEAIGRDYVLSHKPNPQFVTYSLNESEVRKEINDALKASSANNTPMEIILKSVNTISNKPSILEKWNDLVMNMVG